MRMRKKKHGEERLLACDKFLKSGTVSESDGEIWLEIGAGKGGFAIQMARANKNVAYYAMERVSDCVTLAAEAAKRINDLCGELENLKFIVDTADNLLQIFKEGQVSRIFLNFSDPWTKKGYAKRRLTHRRYLALYLNLLKDGGTLRFKTDNVALFDFTLEELRAIGITPSPVTRDLHNSPYNEGNIRTEYEENFSSQGYPINMLEFKKPVGFSIPVSEELTREGRAKAISLHEKAASNKK